MAFLPSVIYSQGPTPADWGLEAYRISGNDLGEINFYMTKDGIDANKPILFLYSGCSGLPAMLVVHHEEKYYQLGTIPPDEIHSFSKQYHVVLLGRAGTPFCDTVKVEEFNPYKNLENYKPSDEYIRRSGMEWEVAAISAVIDTINTFLPNRDSIIVALGISEGGRIMSRLAAEDHRITHLVCTVSGGLNQFYSSIINLRMDAASGKISHEEAQEQINSLFETYKAIYNNPTSTEKWYYGHPYKRWAGFCSDIPVEHLVKLDIPICLINGTSDRSTPILQADYIMLEFIRLGKTNLSYYALPNLNHQLYEVVIDEDGKEHAVSKRSEVFSMINDWIQGQLRLETLSPGRTITGN